MIDPGILYELIPESTVEELSEELKAVGSSAASTTSDAKDTWKKLKDYFHVFGADAVFGMLKQPNKDAKAFKKALNTASKKVDQFSAGFVFFVPSRKAFLEEITEVNQQLRSAQLTLDSASWNLDNACYPPDSAMEKDANKAQKDAERALDRAQSAEADLIERIGRFNDMVETSELDLASALNGIESGTQVQGADGQPVSRRVSQWGNYGASMQDVPMMDRFQSALTDRVIQRLDWMLTDPAGYCGPDGTTFGSTQDWLASHPSFMSALGLLDPQLMKNWFADNTDYVPGGWEPTGAFLTMFNTAPGVIGNINGIPSEVKDLYNREHLEQRFQKINEVVQAELMGAEDPRPFIAEYHYLMAVRESLENEDGVPYEGRFLLSLFSDSEGVRAAVSNGNPDFADMTVTLTHGISTDTKDLPAWTTTGSYLQQELQTELDRRGYESADGRSPVSTIAWFGYDSKGPVQVQNSTHAEVGAARYTAFQNGLEAQNQEGIRNGWFHSYGTTMAGQALGRAPEALDQAYMMGSAGWTQSAADNHTAFEQTPVSASHADRDWTAWMGRTDLVSDHSIDPRTLANVTEISAETGTVDFGQGADGEIRAVQGHEPQGHGAHEHNPMHELWRTQRGYLDTALDPDIDESSRVYLEGVDLVADQLHYTK